MQLGRRRGTILRLLCLESTDLRGDRLESPPFAILRLLRCCLTLRSLSLSFALLLVALLMRVSTLLFAVLALSACVAGVQASKWGIYVDAGCGIALYTAPFTSGMCSMVESSGTKIYFITTCNSDNSKWVKGQTAHSRGTGGRSPAQLL